MRTGIALDLRTLLRYTTAVPLYALIVACQGAYPLDPTACDDYCRAFERKNCADDSPAGCVRECENQAPDKACDEPRRALSDCLLAADDHAFFCRDNRSQIGNLCLPERRSLLGCFVDGSGSCFDECVRQADSCGASLPDCEAACHDGTPGCESAASTYYECVGGQPVRCPEIDRIESPEDACFYEALGLLACGS